MTNHLFQGIDDTVDVALLGMRFSRVPETVSKVIVEENSTNAPTTILEGRAIEELVIIGCIPLHNPANGYFPSPVFSTLPVQTRQGNLGKGPYTDYVGYHAGPLRNGVLTIRKDWAGSIRKEQSGRTWAYFGAGRDSDAVLFHSQPKFDPTKQLYFLVSPSGKGKFDTLAKFAVENRDGTLLDCSIAYTSEQELSRDNKVQRIEL